MTAVVRMRRHGLPVAQRLTWHWLVVVEVAAGLMVLVLMLSMGMRLGEVALTKAKLVNLWPAFRVQRTVLAEQMAVTGHGMDDPDSTPFGPDPRYQAKVVDHSVIASTAIGPQKIPYAITVNPAVVEQGVPGSVMWMCGNRQPPTGWIRLSGPTPPESSSDLDFSVCREPRKY